MDFLQRVTALVTLAAATWLCSGCAATSVLTFAYETSTRDDPDPTCLSLGCAATAVLGYVVDKANEGSPTACYKLNSVARALTARCGAFEPGSLLAKDVAASGLPRCPLSLAARDPQLWPVLPELIAKGARPEACEQAPLVALAQAQPCPDFTRASSEALQSLRWLAETDPHAVHHDALRMLSCPAARDAGLSSVLDSWLAKGQLPAKGLAFSPLGALHPAYLGSPFARTLEARGHSARAALGAYDGRLAPGFDLALRSSDRAALDWWLDRAPELANRVPPVQGDQFGWVPLARVITPSYVADRQQQRHLVEYLLARGANPWQPLPHQPGQTVVSYARQLKSPLLPLLDPPLDIGVAAAREASLRR
ncbi:MAG TPA: hypothetical protein VJ598_04295 [Albitalea sp.]|nr:hypothetical protein [Albitalea sp.]